MYATGETYPVTAVHLDLMALTKDRQPPLTYNFSFEAGNNFSFEAGNNFSFEAGNNFSFEAGNNFSFEADKCINLVKNA